MIFVADKTDDGLKYLDKNRLKEFIRSLPNGKVMVKVSRWYKPRSLNQNRLYWAWLKIIGDDVGGDPEEVHTSFRARFLTDRSRKIPIVRSTTMLNSKQFTSYLDKVWQLAAEMGIKLPTPDEYYQIDET